MNFIVNLKILTPAISYVHTVRKTIFVLDQKGKKTILLFSERYCVSVHDMSNKELTIKIRRDKHNYYKDLFSWVAFWNVQQKQGRKHTSWEFILFWENKVSGLNLFMQLFTHHSPDLRMVLLEHCDTRLRLPLLWNNVEIITTALSFIHTQISSETYSIQIAWPIVLKRQNNRTPSDVKIMSRYLSF